MDAALKTFILDQNARYFGIPTETLMENAGREVAKIVTEKFGRGKRIGVFCGLGNNGGDGFVAARYLARNSGVTVFLIGEGQEIKTAEARKNWERFAGEKVENPKTEEIPSDFDLIIEAIFGVGIRGEVKEPFASVIKRLNKFSCPRVSVDIPAPNFRADLTISLHFAKVAGAVVVDIGISKEVEERVGVGEVKALYKPPRESYKGENGVLLIVGGSGKYHGAPLLAAKIASKIVDLVYFSSTPGNNRLLRKMKEDLCEFIAVERRELEETIGKVDAILVGPGMGVSIETEDTVLNLLKKFPGKRFVLDADALKVIDPKLLGPNCVVTPHRWEFEALFGQSFHLPGGTKGLEGRMAVVSKMAKKYGCTILLKGVVDIVSDGETLKINKTGNQGMSKGGTGDVLAGLVAALACKNDLFLAALASAFLNGLAGDRLLEKVSYYFNASDLVEEIPKAIKWCKEF